MLIACWSVKGGSGTTTVAATLALLLARSASEDVVVADLGGDVPAVLGCPDPTGPGLAGWLAAGPDVPNDALRRLEVEAAPGVRLLPAGATAPIDATALDGERLAAELSGSRRVVVDCGPAGSAAGLSVAAAASISLLVMRPCYLAVRRALAAPIRPSGVILVSDKDRALSRADVEDVLGVPVRAEVPHESAVARAVDAGLLAVRVPRGIERALRAAA